MAARTSLGTLERWNFGTLELWFRVTIPSMISATAPSMERPASRAASATVSWAIDAVLCASTSVIPGVIWAISRRRTIGRDTPGRPPILGLILAASCRV